MRVMQASWSGSWPTEKAQTLRLADTKDGRQPLTSAVGLPQQVPEGPDEINNLGSFPASFQGIASHIVLVNLLFVLYNNLICSCLCLRKLYNIELSYGLDICALTVPLVAVVAAKGCVLSVAVNSEDH